MSAENLPRFSSLRVVREIEPTTEVVNFIKKVEEIGLQTFGAHDEAYVKDRVPFDEELQQALGAGTKYNILPIARSTIYPASDLRLVSLERRAPYFKNMGGNFEKAKSWLRKRSDTPHAVSGHVFQKLANAEGNNDEVVWDIHDIEDRDPLFVHFVSLQRTLNPDYSDLGPEYSMQLNPEDPVTEFLFDEANFVYDVVKSMKQSNRILYPQARTGLEVPVARVPLDSTLGQRVEFVGRVNSECLPLKAKLKPRLPLDK